VYGDLHINYLSPNDLFDLFRPSMGLVHGWLSIGHDVQFDEKPGAGVMHSALASAPLAFFSPGGRKPLPDHAGLRSR